jgi:hypothetical protein
MNPVWHEMQPKVGDTLVSRKKPSAKKRDKKKRKRKQSGKRSVKKKKKILNFEKYKTFPAFLRFEWTQKSQCFPCTCLEKLFFFCPRSAHEAGLVVWRVCMYEIINFIFLT